MTVNTKRGTGRTTRMLWAAAQTAQFDVVYVVGNTSSQVRELARYALELFSAEILANMRFVAVYATGMAWTSDLKVVRIGQGTHNVFVDHWVYESKLEGLRNLVAGATKYDL